MGAKLKITVMRGGPSAEREVSLSSGAAVAQALRVLRPGGRFVALEHVRSPNIIVRGLERLLESYTVRKQADHLLREQLETAQAAGFRIEYLKRQKLGIVERLIARKDL